MSKEVFVDGEQLLVDLYGESTESLNKKKPSLNEILGLTAESFGESFCLPKVFKSNKTVIEGIKLGNEEAMGSFLALVAKGELNKLDEDKRFGIISGVWADFLAAHTNGSSSETKAGLRSKFLQFLVKEGWAAKTYYPEGQKEAREAMGNFAKGLLRDIKDVSVYEQAHRVGRLLRLVDITGEHGCTLFFNRENGRVFCGFGERAQQYADKYNEGPCFALTSENVESLLALCFRQNHKTSVCAFDPNKWGEDSKLGDFVEFQVIDEVDPNTAEVTRVTTGNIVNPPYYC